MHSAIPARISFLLFYLCYCTISHAQLNYSGLNIGINVGTLVYQGELTPKWYGHTRSLRPSVGLQVSQALDDYFAVRADYTHGKILADESVYKNPAWRQKRNFQFSTPVNEITAKLVFNPHGGNKVFNYQRLTTYFFVGAGVSFLNVRRDWSRYETYLENDQKLLANMARDSAHSLPRAVFVLPVGFGFNYTLTERLFLSLDNSLRLSSSDYVDGFRYSNGQNERRDAYYGIALGLNYRFGKSKYDCPTVMR